MVQSPSLIGCSSRTSGRIAVVHTQLALPLPCLALPCTLCRCSAARHAPSIPVPVCPFILRTSDNLLSISFPACTSSFLVPYKYLALWYLPARLLFFPFAAPERKKEPSNYPSSAPSSTPFHNTTISSRTSTAWSIKNFNRPPSRNLISIEKRILSNSHLIPTDLRCHG